MASGSVKESSNNQEVLREYKASELICEVLVNFGVTHVFGGHGGAVVPLIDAIVAHPKITWVYNRCEVNAVQSAMAYAKLNNKLGCCVATSGPGAAHFLSGLVDAEQDRVPLLCLTGLKSAGSIRHADFQDIDQASIFRMAGLGLSESVNHIKQLIPLLRNALYLSNTTYRCTHLAIPIDVQLGHVTAPTHLNFRKENLTKQVIQTSSFDQIEALASVIIKELLDGRKPVIFCGWRAHPFGEAIENLAEFLGAPIITSFDGKGSVTEDIPLSYGVAGIYGFVGGGKSQSVLESCDLVIAICLPDLSKAVSDKSDMQVRRIIQIDTDFMMGDVLRYIVLHSYENRDLNRSLRETIDAMKKKREALKLDRSWRNNVITRKSRLCSHPDNLHPPKAGTCHPSLFFANMSLTLKEDAILCADIGDNALWMASGISAKKGQRTLTSEHMGIMGFALNAGLAAACSAGGKRQVLVVAGDGGFQMSSNELATLKDHDCRNVLVVIIVNGSLGRVNNETWGPGVRADGCFIGSPDYVKLFEAHGYPDGKHLTSSNDDEIMETINNGWEIAAKQGLGLIVVHQDPETFPIMHKISQGSGEAMRERFLKSMNTAWESTVLGSKNDLPHELPSFDFSKQTSEKLNLLQDWIESHENTIVSDYVWVGDNFLSRSPATIFQDLLQRMHPKSPNIFATDEEKERFDEEFWMILMKSYSVEELGELFDRGTSNGHPLRLQILVCPKNKSWKLHAHPNIEMSIGMQGTLYERKLTDYRYPVGKLSRTVPRGGFPTDEGLKDLMNKFETCMFIEDQGDRSEFLERVYVRKGQSHANPIGSVHQSFTSQDNGALVFVLWSGCHANVKLPTNLKHKKGAEILYVDA